MTIKKAKDEITLLWKAINKQPIIFLKNPFHANSSNWGSFTKYLDIILQSISSKIKKIFLSL